MAPSPLRAAEGRGKPFPHGHAQFSPRLSARASSTSPASTWAHAAHDSLANAGGVKERSVKAGLSSGVPSLQVEVQYRQRGAPHVSLCEPLGHETCSIALQRLSTLRRSRPNGHPYAIWADQKTATAIGATLVSRLNTSCPAIATKLGACTPAASSR